MPWVYKVSAHTFYLDGVYQFDAKYSGRQDIRMTLQMSVLLVKGPYRAVLIPSEKLSIIIKQKPTRCGLHPLSKIRCVVAMVS